MSRAELEMRDRIKQRSLRNSYHGFCFRENDIRAAAENTFRSPTWTAYL